MKEAIELAQTLGSCLLDSALKVTCAESCTGGGVAYAITEVPGSSTWFDVGYVTYSNEAKRALLGVAESTLLEHGAVSEAVVIEMVGGALQASRASIGVAISGVAGPAGGSAHRPVGSVWIAWQRTHGVAEARKFQFPGDRHQVREQAVCEALRGLIRLCGSEEK